MAIIEIQRISVKPTAALVGARGRRRAQELFRRGQGGGFHSRKDPRNGLKIFRIAIFSPAPLSQCVTVLQC